MSNPLFKIILLIVGAFLVLTAANLFLVYKVEGVFSVLTLKIYIFHAVFALLTTFLISYLKERLTATIGFFFLYLFIAKATMFLLNFSEFVYGTASISQSIKISTLVAHILFLWLEVYAYFQLLVKEQK
ncbi:MAG: hypothetical protein V4638_01455 [Bacteroidota bacterium]